MFLKRLEICGFKSFADRVTIDFDRGVTAVVGPNGSGKSNVTDAIRWVLGEQSVKSLRGGKMEDIIFAGSETRKQLNFAEVSLTLDNEDHFLPIDYNEVCITRRVYRSGESEFFINKQSCRLKDIVDLMMDSGLGKEAFSIIGQGKVEEILNSKPEERRTIFEEAAGVLKYKNRKKKAEQKLLETEDNLNRVQDILYELESQIEPLQKQAAIAKDYLQKKEELEQYEVALLVHDIEQLHEQWSERKEKLQKYQDQEIELSTKLHQKEAAIVELRDQIQAIDESVEQLQQVLLLTSEELEKLEGKKQVLKERKKNLTVNQQALEKAINECKEKLQALITEKTLLEEKLHEQRKQLAEKHTLLKQKQEQFASYSEDVEEKLETLKSDYIDLLNQEAAIKNEQQILRQQLEQLERQYERLQQENEKYLQERKVLLEKKAEIDREWKNITKKLQQERENYDLAQKKLEKIVSDYQKKEKQVFKMYQLIHEAKSRKVILEEMEDDYTGFHQGVKEILKAKDQLPGIEGAVAELIRVEKPYELAIEIALSASMQYIVVTNEEAARHAINYLKSNSFGRATFLPMSVMKGKQISDLQKSFLKKDPAFIGIASDLISFDEKYRNIIENLLGTVIISRDLKGANQLAKALQYRYRIVTLEGDVVNPGGSMTGGAIKQKTTSLLSRKSELETLKKQIAEMEENCRLLEQSLKNKKQEMKEHEQRIECIKKQGDTLRNEEQRIKEQAKEIEWQEKNLNDRLALFDAEEQSFSQEQERLQKKIEDNTEKLKEMNREIKKVEQEIQKLSEKKTVDQSIKDSLTKEIHELNVDIAKQEEQHRHFQDQYTIYNNQIKEILAQKENHEESLALLIKEMEDDQSGEFELEKASEQKLKEKNATIQLIAERRKERIEYQQRLEDYEQELKEWKRQHKSLTECIKDEEVKLNRLDVELENRLTTLREDYVLTYEAAKEEYPLTVPPEEARKKVKLIKREIDELGTVNLGAIEEYERVNERYTFLMEQKNDLQKAKNTLYQVIEEMDEEMNKRFKETFNGIREQFTSVFRTLFGGGYAELKLTDPNDLLNTGVDIIAQPPGKKLQNLALLSGGERALTAIALLFSILKVRPVPFCVLDEVEAALDEANVYRFSQYLKQFSNETQFIVITHRKGTMEEADVLYGITMQESGVSKIVSVRLEEQAYVI